MKKITNVGADFISAQKKNKGITLIALIITIIVMLILVMVSIQVLFNTGLFDAAGKATQKWNSEQEKEANMQITIGDKTYVDVEEYIAEKNAPKPTDSKYFKISYNENNKTASIDGIKDEYCLEYTGDFGEYGEITSYVPVYIKDGETKITDIVIPRMVEKDGFEYIVTSVRYDAFSAEYNRGGGVGKFDGSEIRSIYIPSSVTSIGDSAFYNCSSLTSIEIPSSVTSIGISTFSGCSSLTSIEIPDSVTSIESYAFSGCSSLTSIEIPASVTGIGQYAFYRCSSLTSIEIPDSVTSIGYTAFFNCSSLTSIRVDANNSVYDSRGNCNAIIEKSTNTLIIGCGNTEIPASVTSIGDSAFSGCSSLTSVTIGESVTSIGIYAFLGCSSLTSVNIPSSVTSIGSSAFYECSSLTSIEIPSSVTSIESSAFSGCSSLTSIEIPDSVTSIKSSAFSGCSSLTSIEIPDSVTSIESYAFSRCSSLTSIEIPDSVTSIKSSAFSGCSSLTDVYYTGSEEEWENITIERWNANLTSANITYNYTVE